MEQLQLEQLHVDDPWFDLIIQRSKTIEGRLAKGNSLLIKPGCLVIISGNGPRTLTALVHDVRRYPSFVAFLTKEGLASTLPGVTTLEAGLTVYRKYYAEGSDSLHGVLAIELRVQ